MSLLLAMGVDAGLVDAHNYATYHMSAASLFFNGIDSIWCPVIGCHTTDAVKYAHELIHAVVLLVFLCIFLR